MSKRGIIISSILILGVSTILILWQPLGVFADTVDDLRQKINSRESSIQQLEQEITEYENQLEDISQQKQTLQSTIQGLNVSESKLEADLAVTQNEIDATNLAIEKLRVEIKEHRSKIEQNNDVLANTMRDMHEMEDSSLVEVVLTNNTLSSFWNNINNLQRLQEVVRVRVQELEQLKRELEAKVTERRKQRDELVALTNELQDRKQVIENTKQEKNQLLAQTENKESTYEEVLAEKRRKKESFEQELRQFESQLQIAIDPGRLPQEGANVLSYPLDSIRVTQYFGNTPFAQKGSYNGKGHNGMDFAASRGTAVHAAAAGTVVDTGNTDLTCDGASYGKWVLVEHEMGLTTLYAHLSVISVSPGDAVSREQTIGYSGNTGYSTGPHLHFTVYASQGVKVDQLESNVCGKDYTLPLAPLDAYLNPLNYLPEL